MNILQVGMAKSGNFWLYKILKSIFRHSGLPYKSFIQNQPIYELAKTWELSYREQADIDVLDIGPDHCFYRISSIFRMPVEDLESYIRQCSQVWSHSEFCELSLSVLPKFSKIIYLLRDPRDVAISMAKFAFTPYMLKYRPHGEPDLQSYLAHKLGSMTRQWVRHVGGYLKYKEELDIHILFYERLLHDFEAEITGLLAYLGLELSQEALDCLRQEVDFQTMKGENPGHVRQGKSGQWRHFLTDKQQKQVVHISGPMLELLNYGVSPGQRPDDLPRLPRSFNISQVERAMMQSNRDQHTVLAKVKRVYQLLGDGRQAKR